MKILAVFIGVVMMGVGSAAWADIYRCTSSDGKTIYQESPCTNGAQKVIDDTELRQRDKLVQKRKEEDDRKAQRAAELKKQWASCQSNNSCVDLCYGAGERLAVVYMANFQVMAENGLMASDLMSRGCQESVGELSADCVQQCQRGFKMEARRVLKN